MNTTNQSQFNAAPLQEELSKLISEKAETEMDIRRGELAIKKLGALSQLEKAKLEFMKLQLEQRRVELEERRLTLEEYQTKYNMASDLAKKSDKIQRVIGKTMLGIFPAQDKQVLKIMEAAQEVDKLKDK